jgi:hypothetical protein
MMAVAAEIDEAEAAVAKARFHALQMLRPKGEAEEAAVIVVCQAAPHAVGAGAAAVSKWPSG